MAKIAQNKKKLKKNKMKSISKRTEDNQKAEKSSGTCILGNPSDYSKIANKGKKLKKSNKIKSNLKSCEEASLETETTIENCILENAFKDSIDNSEIHRQIDITENAENITKENSVKKKKIRGKMEQRSEASQHLSEFNLTEVGKEKVKLDELIKTSTKISGPVLTKKQLQNAKKLKSLSIPLSKPQLEKIKRTVAYDKVCGEVSKWDTIVKSNRDAEQMIFPLKRPEFHLESFETASERFISKHPVEEAVSELLKASENVLDQKCTLTAAEEKALQAMDLQEAKLRHSELMKSRALLSYKEAKARRQNKIKSKRYHRILKKEKLKKMMKEFEELQQTDKKAALEKFLEADKLRILERMTLKHRNTGKWAKQQKIRAKYNPESRSNLKEDLLIGRQLREKVAVELPSVQETIADLDPEDKYFEDSSEKFLIEDVPFDSSATELSTRGASDIFSKNFTQKLQENSNLEEKGSKVKVKAGLNSSKRVNVQEEMEFVSEAACLNSMIPDDITFGDDIDDTEEGKVSISQAFADDDIIAEFQEEKNAAEKANRPEGIDLFLPGWGAWGGPGIKPSKKKRRRFFIKPLEPEPKKNTLGHVIINEDSNKKAAEHQVSQLPFPFSNVHQFESYIRQPVGHTWNPQSSFQSLVAPKVVTKLGKIIDPIDPEDVVLEKKTQTTRPKVKRKKAAQEIKAF